MSQRASWRGLGIGLLAAASILTVALLILIFGRVGTLHGKKFTLFVETSTARGLIRGSDVWLDGQKIGSVRDIDFRSPQTGPKERLVVSLQLLERTRDRIRRDSRVQISAGTSIIGEQVVHITSGTARQPEIQNGDTLRAGDQADTESLASEVALATREFPGIIENLKILAGQLVSTEGTLGAMGLDDGGTELRRVRARASRLMSKLSESDGSIAMALDGMDEMKARAGRAMAQVDSVRALLASNHHSLGRFRRDSTLMVQVKRVRLELSEAQRLAGEPTGAVGRARGDSAIVLAIRRDLRAVDSLMADMKRHPFRYIAF